MTKEKWLEFHRTICERMMKTTAEKNADYTGLSKDPFANFTVTNVFGVATVEQGFFTRMCDKFSRIASFIQKGTLQVKDESVQDTLIDLANYCVLFAGYLESQKAQSDWGNVKAPVIEDDSDDQFHDVPYPAR